MSVYVAQSDTPTTTPSPTTPSPTAVDITATPSPGAVGTPSPAGSGLSSGHDEAAGERALSSQFQLA